MNPAPEIITQIPELPPVARPVYPPWMDARYMLAAAKLGQGADITCDGNGIALIPGNSKRWALGLCLRNPAGATALRLSDKADVALFAFYTQAGALTLNSAWLTVFQYGPLIAYQLYAQANPGDVVRIWEVEVY